VKVTTKIFAHSIGLTPETIRHYREMGLLRPQIRENGYYDYTVDDALTALLTKEMRAYDMPLEFIKDSYTAGNIADYNRLLEEREASLHQSLERIKLELARMQETRVYASCGMRILNGVEEFDGPPTWAVSAVNRTDGFITDCALSAWVEHFPFTYVSATIPLEELKQKQGDEAYNIQIGCGALIHYVDMFRLPLSGKAYYQPGGHFIRTCIKTRDILSLTPNDIAPLHSYAKEKGYTLASCTGGRLLFIENAATEPVYYLLVWVRVEQN
jgi:DNA-binding transcriptional MerR regulator